MRTAAVLTAALLAVACAGSAPAASGDAGEPPTLVIGGIPDQDFSVLEERFGGVAAYLTDRLGVSVRYQPSTSYAALVTAFRNGDVLLGWFGGLTGVQARLAVPGAQAVAQRPIDEEFRSVFIAAPGVDADTLADLKGLTFTFGSESSTSGHLMPRHYLLEAGIDPDVDFDGRPGYSGSHDKTWKLVEAGSFQAGALNEAVWERAVSEGGVDTGTVRVVGRTPPYYDYHWVAHPGLEAVYGEGALDRVTRALQEMGTSDDPAVRRTLELFDTDRFIPTTEDNYRAIEKVARDLGLVAP